MNAERVANEICSELVTSVERWREDIYLITRFQYPDGDQIPIYVESNGVLTDRGTTIYKLVTAGLELNQSRTDLIDSVCASYGIRFADEMFCASSESVSDAVLSLCEALVRISNLAFDVHSRKHITLGQEIASLLVERVQPSRAVYKDWISTEHDPRSAYPVDFRMNTKGVPRHIFHVSNAMKSDRVAAVSNFLQMHEIIVPTLTIVYEDARLPKKHRNRLEMASTHIRYNGLAGNEDYVVDFALGAD
jgi:hypothetical protein